MLHLQDYVPPQGSVTAVTLTGAGGSSSGDVEIFALVVGLAVIVFSFIVLVVWMTNRAKARSERLKVMEEALRSERLDAEAKAELVAALTGRGEQRDDLAPGWQRAAFGAGWVGLLMGATMMLVDEGDSFGKGLMCAGFGVAAMTLPLAIREFDRAGRAQRARGEA